MVDVALTDCTLAAMTNIAQYYLTSGALAPRVGNAHSTIVPYQDFQTKDGHIIIAVGNNEQFTRFCTHIGKPEWAKDPRFAKNKDRVLHRDTLVPMIAKEILEKTTEEWLNGLRSVDVPCGPINTMDKVFATEQIQSRDMQISMAHPLGTEKISLVGSPIKMSQTPTSYDFAPPICGQHTQEVLSEILQISPADIAALTAKGVVQTTTITHETPSRNI